MGVGVGVDVGVGVGVGVAVGDGLAVAGDVGAGELCAESGEVVGDEQAANAITAPRATVATAAR